MSDNDHSHLGQTWNGSNNPLVIEGIFNSFPNAGAPLILNNLGGAGLYVGSAASDGVDVESASFNGLFVNSAGRNGLYVNSTGYDGVHVNSAGAASAFTTSALNNGFEVEGAEGYGLYVGRADSDGVYVSSTGGDGVSVGSAGQDGLNVGTSAWAGVFVNSAGGDGVLVHHAGTPSTETFSPLSNGFEVEGAQGYGMYIGRSDDDGIRIRSTGNDAIQIGEDGVFPSFGLWIPSPGVSNTALFVQVANGAGEWALLTSDKISASNVTAAGQTLLAVVGGSQTLSAGDVVGAIGLAGTLPDGHDRLARVQRAGASSGIVGVVSSRMALQAMPGKDGAEELHSIGGPAQPGDYVAITVLGAAQVKVQDGETLLPGQRVTVGANGAVRALQTRTGRRDGS